MEMYLTVKELSSRIKFSKQTIYNLIHQRVFVLGKHYFKPVPKKILFKWSEIEAWIENPSDSSDGISSESSAETTTPTENHADNRGQSAPSSLINI